MVTRFISKGNRVSVESVWGEAWSCGGPCEGCIGGGKRKKPDNGWDNDCVESSGGGGLLRPVLSVHLDSSVFILQSPRIRAYNVSRSTPNPHAKACSRAPDNVL